MKHLTIHRAATPHDFCWAIEGEIAVPPMVCDNRDCGCDRSHAGLNSHRASTAVRVADTGLDYDDLVTAATAFVEDTGWADVVDDPDALAANLVTASVEIATNHPVGTVLRPMFDRHASEWHYEEELHA